MDDLFVVTVVEEPGNGTRYELLFVVDYDRGRVAVCWPEQGTAGWFPLYDCVPTYIQSKLRVPFGDAVAIRNILIAHGIWTEDE